MEISQESSITEAKKLWHMFSNLELSGIRTVLAALKTPSHEIHKEKCILWLVQKTKYLIKLKNELK